MTPGAIAGGLLEFKREFKGKIFLEILLVDEINSSDENLGKLKDFCQRLAPDRVDVVTVTRPGTVTGVRPPDGAVLKRWRMALDGGAAETGPAKATRTELSMERATALIEASLARRPQTVSQLAQALNADETVVRQAVEALQKVGDVVSRDDRETTYYHGAGHVIEEAAP